MITNLQKKQVADRLIEESVRLGSWAKVATYVNANIATVSRNMAKEENWGNVSDAMWAKVAGVLGISLSTQEWQYAETTNVQIMRSVLKNAQENALFMAVSHTAGHGKTAGCNLFRQDDTQGAVFYIECQESWSHKRFVEKLAELCGIRTGKATVADLLEQITNFFHRKTAEARPILIIDEANKLKPSSLRLIIPLYNELQDEIALVIIGAHDLRDHIKRGVRRDVRGYDEMESRLGRSYMPLYGILKSDVVAVCAANGVSDQAKQELIWNEMKPAQQAINGRYVNVATEDYRRLKLLIKSERNRA